MGESKQAPGRLRLVQDFINTLEHPDSGDAELIGSPAAYSGWLRQRGLLSPAAGEVEESEWERALAVREALRRLALANNGGRVYPLDLAVLNQAAGGGQLRLKFLPSGISRLEPEQSSPSAALTRLLLIVHEAMADGSWRRLKACREPTCAFAFYDSTKNRSGAWCTMAVCGNRTKARSYRSRRREATA